METNKCNCGLLVREIMNLEEKDLNLNINGDEDNNFTWEALVKDYSEECTMTGIKISYIISKLISIGLSKKDIIQLESLSNLDIYSKLKNKYLKYDNKQDLILYLKTFADILDEQNKLNIKNKNEEIVPVRVNI